MPPAYFEKHNLAVASVRDTDRENFNPFKKSNFEQATEAVGVNVFNRVADIRNLPQYKATRAYFNQLTMGVGGEAFNMLWNKLHAENHWLTDRY